MIEKDVDGIHDLHKIRFDRRLPADLPNILFDASNNLRPVLDQAGYAAAVASGNTRLRAIKFPFGRTEEFWRKNLKEHCQELPTEIQIFFASFKSYKEGNIILWALNELCNAGKQCRTGYLEGLPADALNRSQEGLFRRDYFQSLRISCAVLTLNTNGGDFI